MHLTLTVWRVKKWKTKRKTQEMENKEKKEIKADRVAYEYLGTDLGTTRYQIKTAKKTAYNRAAVFWQSYDWLKVSYYNHQNRCECPS